MPFGVGLSAWFRRRRAAVTVKNFGEYSMLSEVSDRIECVNIAVVTDDNDLDSRRYQVLRMYCVMIRSESQCCLDI